MPGEAGGVREGGDSPPPDLVLTFCFLLKYFFPGKKAEDVIQSCFFMFGVTCLRRGNR